MHLFFFYICIYRHTFLLFVENMLLPFVSFCATHSETQNYFPNNYSEAETAFYFFCHSSRETHASSREGMKRYAGYVEMEEASTEKEREREISKE